MKFATVKTFVMFTLLASLFGASDLHAQARPSAATQVISVDFVPLLIQFPMSVQYEIKADPTDSWLFRLNLWTGITNQYTGYSFGASYRFYIADSRALTGLSVGPGADLFFFNQPPQPGGNGTRTAIGVDLGVDLSYKWIFDQFAVEPTVGLRYGLGGANAPGAFTTIFPIIGCSLGYAW